MSQEYINQKNQKTGITKRGIIVLLIFVVLFLSVIFRFAIRSDFGGFFNQLPSGDDAFEVSKDFVRPTLKAVDAHFAEDSYQYTKLSDSVYEVKSYFETNSNFQTAKTNYDAVLKYKGGSNLNDRNWSLVKLQTN